MHLFCFFMFLFCTLVLVGVVVAIVLIALNPKQLFRRIGTLFTETPFGLGTDFQIKNIKHSKYYPVAPEIMFSISLFGNPDTENFKKRYFSNLIKMLQGTKIKWPKAAVRVYVSENIPDHMQNTLLDHGATLYVVSPPCIGYEGSMWRFWAVDDCTVPCMMYDADDADFSSEYMFVVKEWLRSKKPFFVKRYLWHTLLPMCACKWGSQPFVFKKIFGTDIKPMTRRFFNMGYGCDEGFLNRAIWPVIKHHAYISKIAKTEYSLIPLLCATNDVEKLISQESKNGHTVCVFRVSREPNSEGKTNWYEFCNIPNFEWTTIRSMIDATYIELIPNSSKSNQTFLAYGDSEGLFVKGGYVRNELAGNVLSELGFGGYEYLKGAYAGSIIVLGCEIDQDMGLIETGLSDAQQTLLRKLLKKTANSAEVEKKPN